MWRFDGNDRSLTGFFFSVLQGCETELDKLFRGVLGYALLVILGFAIIKVKFLVISEAN